MKSSNRCETLEGHEGAYNIFNMEARLDKIITRLDDISRHLETIQYNQNTLYNTVKRSNRNIEKLQDAMERSVKSLDNISGNSSVTVSQLEKLVCNSELVKFNTEQTRREIELRNRMDGIFQYR